ncbi:MAG: hypothetical protein FGM14_07225 [Flavobacteriales bacterium]|nr:hypothetical protein [Flavobacteriales bacterium]
MNIETKKLNLIERIMRIKQVATIDKFETLITDLELQARTETSLSQIQNNEVRSYESFSNEVEQWLKEKNSK